MIAWIDKATGELNIKADTTTEEFAISVWAHGQRPSIDEISVIFRSAAGNPMPWVADEEKGDHRETVS